MFWIIFGIIVVLVLAAVVFFKGPAMIEWSMDIIDTIMERVDDWREIINACKGGK